MRCPRWHSGRGQAASARVWRGHSSVPDDRAHTCRLDRDAPVLLVLAGICQPRIACLQGAEASPFSWQLQSAGPPPPPRTHKCPVPRQVTRAARKPTVLQITYVFHGDDTGSGNQGVGQSGFAWVQGSVLQSATWCPPRYLTSISALTVVHVCDHTHVSDVVLLVHEGPDLFDRAATHK